MVQAYPTPENWRDALLIYRDLYKPEPTTTLDTLRLLRSTKALSGERDYLEFADALKADANAGERKAVLDEGVSVKMVDPAKPQFKTLIAATGKKAVTAKAGLAAMEKKAQAASGGDAALAAGDAYFGYGDYAKAAALYKSAIAKGSVDANVANTRLGMALALSGQRAEAETALRLVTGAAIGAGNLLAVVGRPARPGVTRFEREMMSMKTVSTFALGVALAVGGIAAVPAVAQTKKEAAAAAPAPPARKFEFSKEARKPLADLQKALEGTDDAAYATAVAAARPRRRIPTTAMWVAQFQLRHAIAKNSDPEKLVALQAMVQSGGATPQELPALYQNIGALNYQAKQMDQAAEAFAKEVELTPNSSEAILRLAQVKADQNKGAEAVPLLQRAIQIQKASGQAVPENWYKLALRYAYESNNNPLMVTISKELIAAYPTTTNWRDGLVLYRDAANLDKGASLDLMRLMRASKSLSGDRDWFDLADAANDAGLPGETKAVLDEAAASRAVDTTKPVFKDLSGVAGARIADDKKSLIALEKQAATAAQGRVAANTADAFLGYGDYAKAADLYRTALQKGSVDANVINTRLGIALALAGQKAEAETAFKAVSGPRTELASFWLLWLSQRG